MASDSIGPATCPICPGCGGASIKPRRTWSSTALPVSLFFLCLWLASTDAGAPVGALLAIALVVLFGVSIAAIASAALGHNRCMRCGARWG